MLQVLETAENILRCSKCENTRMVIYHRTSGLTKEVAQNNLAENSINPNGFSNAVEGNLVFECVECKSRSYLSVEKIQPRLDLTGFIKD